ncbi:alpha/beta hydrolase [Streptomyces sp. NPDC005423]|uniref:alpha/beta hydrolase n=1 Tax=Streptomyces sp. NPDC005423 TaxID=3155343 RepID=UPI0033B90C52
MLARFCTRPALRRCAFAGAVTLSLLNAGLPATTTADTAGDRPQPDLSRFYRQKVKWAGCDDMDAPKDLQCGKVTVPLDYARPGAGTLDLAVARFRATGRSRGSVLLNFGGPGGAGVAELGSGGKDFMGLTNGYDVVGFDPRGVGLSSPVSCGEGADDASDTADPGAQTDHPAALLRELRKSADVCAKYSGPVLPHIGTVNASRDLDVIRQALGDRKLNYLGFSYGTRLGAVYAAQFPTKVGRVVLDGVDTLTEPMTEQGIAGAQGQQTALEDFLGWCVRDIACPFGQDARSAPDQVVRLVRALDRNPVPTGYGDRFTGQDLVGGISQALYSRQLWPSLERAVASLTQDGDTRPMMAFSSGGAAPRPGGHGTGGGLVGAQDVPVDNLPAALMAIDCADDPDRPTAGRITRDLPGLRARFDEASPVFGRYRLTEILMCYGRPRGTHFIRDRVKNVDSAKFLLVGTRGDPATPYRWTVETAQRLGSSAVVLDNKGEGHTGYASSKCVHAKVDAFLLYGSLPPNGSSCPADNANTP